MKKIKKLKIRMPERVTRFACRAGLTIKKKSPEILFCVGTASFIGAIISAVIASKEHDEILFEHEEMLEDAKNEYLIPDDLEIIKVERENDICDGSDSDAGDSEEEYEFSGEVPVRSEKEVNRSIRKAYMKTAGKFIRLYSKTAGFMVVSLACYGGVYKVLSGRVAAGLVTISGLENYISLYEKRNVEINGEKSHDMCKYGYKDIEHTYEDPETGEMVTEVERVPLYEVEDTDPAESEHPSEDAGSEVLDEMTREVLESGPAVIIFSPQDTRECKGVVGLDKTTLEAAEGDARLIWRTRGWVTQNDIRSYLGLPPTVMGQRKCLFYHEGNPGPEPTLNIYAPINNAAMNGTRKSWILETNLSEDLFLADREEKRRKDELTNRLIKLRLEEEGVN